MIGRVVWTGILVAFLGFGISHARGRTVAKANLVHGTAIAAIRTPKGFAMAADRRVVDENSRIVTNECKIRIVIARGMIFWHPRSAAAFARWALNSVEPLASAV